MELHFITSLSEDYWNNTAKYCIPTWNLPGRVTIYIDQRSGGLDWIRELPYHCEYLYVPPLNHVNEFVDKKKVMKFWGKSCAQMTAVRNRENNERIIWLDSDIEQLAPLFESDFNFDFSSPMALMNSNDGEDCWETGLVIFNHNFPKMNVIMNRYNDAWNDEEILNSLWKPYDAPVLGYVAAAKGFTNLCEKSCKNIEALENTIYKDKLKHWINKDNKKLLAEKNNEDSDDISQIDTEL